MKLMRLGALMCLSIGICYSSPIPEPFINIDDARMKLPAAFSAFPQQPTSDMLRELYFMCEHIPENRSSSSWTDDREFKLTSLLTLLTIIDETQNPSFDPKKPGAYLNPLPPPAWGVIPGESPQDVKDPAIRAQYEQLIADNEKKKQFANLQNDLIRIRKETIAYTSRFIKSRYPYSERNQTLNQVIQTHLANDPKSTDIVNSLMGAVGSPN